jgi:hypothetical protein
LRKAGLTYQVLTGGQGHPGMRAQLLPIGQAAAGAQRLLEPCQATGPQARQHGQRVGQVTGLVDVSHQVSMGAGFATLQRQYFGFARGMGIGPGCVGKVLLEQQWG